MDFPQVHLDIVNGLRVAWVAGTNPNVSAVLLIRVGMVDEWLPQRGITHLIEHLALRDLLRPGNLSINGEVGLGMTRFYFHGSMQEVTEAISHVINFLNEPDLSALENEAKVLGVEDETRAPSDLLLWRFGMKGPGNVATPEYFLKDPNPELIHAHLERYYCLGNTILVMDHQPPADLPQLRAGAWVPTPEATAIIGEYPKFYTSKYFQISGVVERCYPAVIAVELLRWRLLETLRKEYGLAYSPSAQYIKISSHQVLLVCGAEANSQELLPALVGMRIFNDLARQGPQPCEIESLVAEQKKGLLNSNSTIGFAISIAEDQLSGNDLELPEMILAELETIDAASVQQVFQQWQQTLMLSYPTEESPLDYIPREKAPIPVVTGKTFQSLGPKQYRRQLTVGDDGFTMTGPGEGMGLLWQHLRVVHETTDGALLLIDTCGWRITIEPTLWKNGRELVTLIRQRIPHYVIKVPVQRSASDIPRPKKR